MMGKTKEKSGGFIMARQYCIVCEDTGHIVYVGVYGDCKEHLRTLIEDDYDRYSIEHKEA